MTKSEEFVKAVDDAFPDADSIYAYPNKHAVEFQVRADDVTFARLEQLSVALKTKRIDFEDGYYSSGCESCGYGSSHRVNINVRDIGV